MIVTYPRVDILVIALFTLASVACNKYTFVYYPYSLEIERDDLICSRHAVRTNDSFAANIAKERDTGYTYAYCECLDTGQGEHVIQYWPINGAYLSTNQFLIASTDSIIEVIHTREQMLQYLNSRSLSQKKVNSFMAKYDLCQQSNKGASGVF